MQKLGWYVKRLQSMSAAEIAWRLGSASRKLYEAPLYSLGYAPGANLSPPCESLGDYPAFRLSPTKVGELADMPAAAEWVERLLREADKIRAAVLSFFDLRDVHLGDPIDWHRDHAAGRSAPKGLIHFLDYRDFPVVGDCKLVWEPNRHHHLVVLARAYRATGRTEYAQAVADQLASWLENNPFGYGMNWRSPLELGIRLINWVWALDLIKESDVIGGELWSRLYRSVYQHCLEIASNYSRGSSANNHLIGEAAGVYVAASYFRTLPSAADWVAEAAAVLEREIVRQTFDDGCTREHAIGYECFVAQFFVACKHVAAQSGRPFDSTLDARLGRMFEFMAALAAAGSLPMFGDADDGYVLDLGNPPHDVESWLAVGRLSLGDKAPPIAVPDRPPETAYWLFGRTSGGGTPAAASTSVPLDSVSFPSGYSLLQTGSARSQNVSVLFDCAELGYGAIAAHGHADALSIVLRADGRCILVDPGTFDYFSYPAWRTYFRSTAAHNTVRVDEADQSVMTGPFMWDQPAHARLARWRVEDTLIEAEGEHSGYERLADPVRHRRRLILDRRTQALEVTDILECTATHVVEIFWHVSPDCRVERLNATTVRLTNADTAFCLDVDPALELTCHSATTDGFLGWISEGYHRKRAGHTLVARARIAGASQFVTTIRREADGVRR